MSNFQKSGGRMMYGKKSNHYFEILHASKYLLYYIYIYYFHSFNLNSENSEEFQKTMVSNYLIDVPFDIRGNIPYLKLSCLKLCCF